MFTKKTPKKQQTSVIFPSKEYKDTSLKSVCAAGILTWLKDTKIFSFTIKFLSWHYSSNTKFTWHLRKTWNSQQISFLSSNFSYTWAKILNISMQYFAICFLPTSTVQVLELIRDIKIKPTAQNRDSAVVFQKDVFPTSISILCSIKWEFLCPNWNSKHSENCNSTFPVETQT